MEQLGKELGNMSNYYKHDSSIVSVSQSLKLELKYGIFVMLWTTHSGENTVIGQNVLLEEMKIGKM